jgi:octaprenyl-diphosphate synthase
MQAALDIVGEELKLVELQFRKDLESDVPLIRKVGEYVLSSGGKRVRPALLLLSARLCGYSADKAVPLASVVEFIHTATLLHDDVVDRPPAPGIASANTWGNEAWCWLGFLFSNRLLMAGQPRHSEVFSMPPPLLPRRSPTAALYRQIDLSESVYRCGALKTAILMSAACEAERFLGAFPISSSGPAQISAWIWGSPSS